MQASALSIPFRQAFKHASAERASTQSVWVECRSRDGIIGFGEGCPREYVTGESVDSARGFVARHVNEWIATVHDLDSLAAWVHRGRPHIDRDPAAWTAVELALLDLLGKHSGRTLEALLGLSQLSGSFRYTAVIGDSPSEQFEAQLASYVKAGFSDFKIKLSGDLPRDREKIRLLIGFNISPTCVRADANNLWREPERAVHDLRALNFPFLALEEPLRAGDFTGLRRVAEALDTRIILDESLLRAEQLDVAGILSERCIINVRVSKMGGLVRSLELAREARRRGFPLIVGAHVGETSILTRAALALASSVRDCLIAQEGAFGTHLLQRDVTSAPIMFGAGGMLDTADASFARRPGLGFTAAA